MDYEHYILDALETVMTWELPEEDIPKAINDQARLMAGLPFEESREVRPDA